MASEYRKRRLFIVLVTALVIITTGLWQDFSTSPITEPPNKESSSTQGKLLASGELEQLEVKGRAPKTGYTRSQFGEGWRESGGCSTREMILARDLEKTVIKGCTVLSGVLKDTYTDKTISFTRGHETSDDIQIDHVVALSDAWQKGAQQLTPGQRENLANDPLELLAVDGPTNQAKSDGDAATWLPPNKSYRCQYVARQVAVKIKYSLWVTSAEKTAMKNIFKNCPDQALPVES